MVSKKRSIEDDSVQSKAKRIGDGTATTDVLGPSPLTVSSNPAEKV